MSGSATAYTLDVIPFTAQRVTLRSDAPFDDVIARFESDIPPLPPETLYPWVDRGDSAAFRQFLEAHVPPSGFVHFQAFDQGGGMTLLGIPMQSRYYLVGNVLLATDLFRREPAAGLVAPIRVVISSAPGHGTQLDYDEPTSICAQFPALRESPVPAVLDTKLRAIFAAAMHAEPEGALP